MIYKCINGYFYIRIVKREYQKRMQSGNLKMRLILFFLIFGLAATAVAKQELSDEEIRAMVIQQSIAQYPGVCACPYSVSRNGSRCGGRSAYSKPGGYSPICFPHDVPDEMVRLYRQRQ
jgi:hypothetical protein